MAVDPLKYRRIKNGMGHEAALYLSDSANSPQKATTVAAPSALTAPTTMNAAYTQTEVQALRTDVANLRTTVNTLITNLKAAGVVS
jgi:uncharacterized secreted protein with C-terminal beta-propeller domain